MKTRLLCIALVMFSVSICSAQTVTVTSKKVTYKRSKSAPEPKRSFTINSPKIAGAMGQKIEAILSYEKNFDFKIQDQLKEEFWVDDASFEVKYNKNNILQVDLFLEGSGAYPTVSTKHIVINSKTGTRVKPSDVFTKLDDLATICNKRLQAEIKAETPKIKKEEPDFDASEYFKNAKFVTESLWAFTVSDKGVTFHYNYDFPHVIQALQPSGDFLFSWAQLKTYVKKDGLFGRFAT